MSGESTGIGTRKCWGVVSTAEDAKPCIISPRRLPRQPLARSLHALHPSWLPPAAIPLAQRTPAARTTPLSTAPASLLTSRWVATVRAPILSCDVCRHVVADT
jgi:hypothetical protein